MAVVSYSYYDDYSGKDRGTHRLITAKMTRFLLLLLLSFVRTLFSLSLSLSRYTPTRMLSLNRKKKTQQAVKEVCLSVVSRSHAQEV